MGHTVVREYVEHESGGKGVDQRPHYAQLLADAARREFDMVLVWALDRFSRNGMAATVLDLQRLSSYGATSHSFAEPHLSTDNEPVRDVLLAPLSSLAKLERAKISERTKPPGNRFPVGQSRPLPYRIGRRSGIGIRHTAPPHITGRAKPAGGGGAFARFRFSPCGGCRRMHQ